MRAMFENHAMSTDPDPQGEAHEIRGLERVGLWVLGTIIKLWTRTVRMKVSPESREIMEQAGAPIALVVWHNRLFMGPELTRRLRGGRPFHGIVSASKDGAWAVGFFEMMGLKAIRGSSSWGAREGAQAMIRTAQAGHDLGITPDGPRGPCYQFKPGILIIARRAKVPLLLVGVRFSRFKQLRSWDRFIIPWPFSSVTVTCRKVMPEDLPSARDAALTQLEQTMRELNGEDY
jgi:lysophospholipid acyltransferase (LPLAT)-like uncharacterized protein